MKFCVKEWRQIFDEIKIIGQSLKDGRPSWDNEKKTRVSSPNPMPEDEQIILEENIKNLIIKNNSILEGYGMRPHPPLWKYHRDDRTTWASHHSFAYSHLLKTNKRTKRAMHASKLEIENEIL